MAGKKDPNAQAIGRLGGMVRAKRLSRERRAEIARLGGKARAAKLAAVKQGK